jgi:hypothetical protein
VIAEYARWSLLQREHPRRLRLRTVTQVDTAGEPEPVYAFELCEEEAAGRRDLPVFGLFAGVHGIEAIGVTIVLAFAAQLLERAAWNAGVVQLLRRLRIVGIPLVNPAGFVGGSRSNGRGVDLMRNGPDESPDRVPLFGGHRLGPQLPFFRGWGTLEPEAQALCELVERELLPAPFALALDIHSGFGLRDSLWTPWAARRGLPPGWSRYRRLREVLDRSLLHHRYRLEPQSTRYCAAGDLWDLLYGRSLAAGGAGAFLPLTLEVGTWRWLAESPYLALRWWNYFNPSRPRRQRKALRRHLPLLHCLAEIAADHERALVGDGADEPR